MKSSSELFEAEFEAEMSCVSGTILAGFGGLGTGCTSTLTVCCSATKMTDPLASVSLDYDIFVQSVKGVKVLRKEREQICRCGSEVMNNFLGI